MLSLAELEKGFIISGHLFVAAAAAAAAASWASRF